MLCYVGKPAKKNLKLQIKISFVTYEFGENNQVNRVVESLTILIGEWMYYN